MRLVGVHIYGYGVFRDFSLARNDFNGSPVLIYGLNEAGKSTFMSFVRGVLFGFKAEGNKPVPVRGGRIGGCLLLENGAGEVFRIERTGKRDGKVVVELPDGTMEGDGFLKTYILRGISPVLFKNVFAVGMDELRKLDDLKREEVNAHIYGAGTGVNPGKLARAINYLQSSSRDLFNPRGRVQEINKLLSRLRDAGKRVKQLEQQPAQYWKLKDEQVKLKKLQANLDRERRKLELRKNRLDNLIKAREPWLKIESLNEQLQKLPSVDTFPADGISRLEKLLERRNNKREEFRRCDVYVRDLRDRFESIVFDSTFMEYGQAIRELYNERSLFVEKRQRLWEEETRVKQLEEQLQNRLADLGPRWDENSVLELDLSISAYRKVEEFGECFRTLEEEIKSIARARESCEEEVEQRQQQLNLIDNKLSVLPVHNNKVSLEERFATLEKLTISLQELQTAETKIDGERHRQEDLRARKDFAEKNLESAGNYPKFGWAVWTLMAAAVTGLFTAGFNFTGIFLLAAGMGLAVLLKRILSKIQIETSNRREHFQREIDTLEQTLERIDSNITQLNAQLKKQREKINAAARKLNWDCDIHLPDIPEIRRKLEQEREEVFSRERLEREKTEAGKMLAAAHHNLEILKRNEHGKQEKKRQLEKEWRQWLQRQSLPDLNPAGIISFLHLAEKARDVVNKLKISREEYRQVAGFVNGYMEKVNVIAKGLDMEPATGKTVTSCVVSLFASLQEQEEKLRLRRELRGKLEEAEAAFKLAKVELKEVDNALNELLRLGQAGDEEVFRARAGIFSRREQLKHDLENLKEHILSMAGSPRNLAEFCAELKNSTREDNLQELENVKEELDRVDEKMKQISNDIVEKRLRIEQMEYGEELARVRQERNMLQERLAQKAREWRVYTLCSTLLDMAREKYERDRQPGVLLKAGSYLEPMTGGRYTRVISPVGSPEQLRVEQRRGERVEVANLSRGTANQLYLSLRLALAKHYGDSVAPLPVMLDDIMVDFDHKRLAGAVQVVRELAAEHQVLFFTCHRHIKDLFSQLIPGYKCISLDDGKKASQEK